MRHKTVFLAPLMAALMGCSAFSGDTQGDRFMRPFFIITTVGVTAASTVATGAREVAIDGEYADEAGIGLGISAAAALVLQSEGGSGGSAGAGDFQRADFDSNWDQLKEQTARGAGPWLDAMLTHQVTTDEAKAALIVRMREAQHFENIFQADKALGWLYFKEMLAMHRAATSSLSGND